MRNLLEYPVTKDEIVKELETQAKIAKDAIIEHGICGDMGDLLLTLAAKIVKEHGKDIYTVDELPD